MPWLPQFVLIASTLVGSWLGMQAVHELGHMCGAWTTGGTIERVVLHPLTISRTDVGHNPRPRTVVWAGPLVGVGLPLLVWITAAAIRLRLAYLLRFFAGFCLLANGLYLGVGSFAGVGDAGDLLQLGTPMWHLWVFGIVTAPGGLALWHGEGRHFGLGPHRQPVKGHDAAAAAASAIFFLLLGLMVGGD